MRREFARFVCVGAAAAVPALARIETEACYASARGGARCQKGAIGSLLRRRQAWCNAEGYVLRTANGSQRGSADECFVAGDYSEVAWRSCSRE